MPSPPAPANSPTAQLLEQRIGGSLHDWIAARRQATPRQSWRAISLEIWLTWGVDVTDNTLRRWFPDLTATGQAEAESEGL